MPKKDLIKADNSLLAQNQWVRAVDSFSGRMKTPLHLQDQVSKAGAEEEGEDFLVQEGMVAAVRGKDDIVVHVEKKVYNKML